LQDAASQGPTTAAVSWTVPDVGRGMLLFVAVFLGAQVVAVVFGAPFGLESNQFYAAVFVASALGELGYAAIALRYARRSRTEPLAALGVHGLSFATIWWAIGGLIAALAVSAAYSGLIEVFDINALRASCEEQIPGAVREEACSD